MVSKQKISSVKRVKYFTKLDDDVMDEMRCERKTLMVLQSKKVNEYINANMTELTNANVNRNESQNENSNSNTTANSTTSVLPALSGSRKCDAMTTHRFVAVGVSSSS